MGKTKRSAVQDNGDIRSFFSKKPASTPSTGSVDRVSRKRQLSETDESTGSRVGRDGSAGVGSKKQKLSEPVPAGSVAEEDLDSDVLELAPMDMLYDDLLSQETPPDPSSPEFTLGSTVLPEYCEEVEDLGPETWEESDVVGMPIEQPYHRKVFHRLCRGAERFQQKTGRRPYHNFVRTHGEEHLFQCLMKSIKDSVWDEGVEKRNCLDTDFLATLPDDASDHKTSGWYLIVLWGNQSTDTRVYVGQSIDVSRRVRQHLHGSKDVTDTKFLYSQWRQIPNCQSCITCLGLDQSGFTGDEAPLFLNLVEMYLGLMFESLQSCHLNAWLPPSGVGRVHRGLNVALPLAQGVRSTSWIGRCCKSDDPALRSWARSRIVQAWWDANPHRKLEQSARIKALHAANPTMLSDNMKAYHARNPGVGARNLQAALAANVANDYRGFARAGRASSSNFSGDDAVLRSAEATDAPVQVKHDACGHVFDDPSPAYIRVTGEYYQRQILCRGCRKRACMRRVDGAPSVKITTFHQRMKKPKWKSFYLGQSTVRPVALRGRQ